MNVLADALKHLDELEKVLRGDTDESDLPGVVLDIMLAKQSLIAVIGDLNAMEV